VLCIVNTSSRLFSSYWSDWDATGEGKMISPNRCRYAALGSKAAVFKIKYKSLLDARFGVATTKW